MDPHEDILTKAYHLPWRGFEAEIGSQLPLSEFLNLRGLAEQTVLAGDLTAVTFTFKFKRTADSGEPTTYTLKVWDKNRTTVLLSQTVDTPTLNAVVSITGTVTGQTVIAEITSDTATAIYVVAGADNNTSSPTIGTATNSGEVTTTGTDITITGTGTHDIRFDFSAAP